MKSFNYNSVLKKIEKESKKRNIKMIVIGASIGGPKALEKVLSEIPSNINMPILIVQHMFKEMTGKFAERLDSLVKVKVKEAEDGEDIKAGVVYIAKGDFHMLLNFSGKITLEHGETINGVRPAVDELFVSAAKIYKEKLLSVVLTGMGKDGAIGTVEVKKQGGYCISEAEETCFIYGMPKACKETGVIDAVLPIDLVSKAIVTFIKG